MLIDLLEEHPGHHCHVTASDLRRAPQQRQVDVQQVAGVLDGGGVDDVEVIVHLEASPHEGLLAHRGVHHHLLQDGVLLALQLQLSPQHQVLLLQITDLLQ